MVISIDRGSGKTKWQKVAREEVPHEGHHPDHDFASASPITDGETLFSTFRVARIACLRFERELGMAERPRPDANQDGFRRREFTGASGNTVVVNWDHEGDDFIVAFDKHTGKELWRQSREEDTSWSTPLVVEYEGKAQVVTAATRKFASYDLDSGKLVWETEGLSSEFDPDASGGRRDGFRHGRFPRKQAAGDSTREERNTGSDAIAWTLSRSTPTSRLHCSMRTGSTFTRAIMGFYRASMRRPGNR